MSHPSRIMAGSALSHSGLAPTWLVRLRESVLPIRAYRSDWHSGRDDRSLVHANAGVPLAPEPQPNLRGADDHCTHGLLVDVYAIVDAHYRRSLSLQGWPEFAVRFGVVATLVATTAGCLPSDAHARFAVLGILVLGVLGGLILLLFAKFEEQDEKIRRLEMEYEALKTMVEYQRRNG